MNHWRSSLSISLSGLSVARELDRIINFRGRPEMMVSDTDAANEMADSFERCRDEISKEEGGALKLSIGLHFGNVVVGDVGSENRLEFATLGDVVNVASRLEEATRQFECRVLVGEPVIIRARNESGDEAGTLIESLEILGPIKIAGRAATETAYRYR